MCTSQCVLLLRVYLRVPDSGIYSRVYLRVYNGGTYSRVYLRVYNGVPWWYIPGCTMVYHGGIYQGVP